MVFGFDQIFFGFSVLDYLFYGFAVSNRPQCPLMKDATGLSKRTNELKNIPLSCYYYLKLR